MKFKSFWLVPMLMFPAVTIPIIATSCSKIKEEIQESIVEDKYEKYKNYVNKTVNAHIKMDNDTEIVKCLVEIVNETGVQLKNLNNS